MAVQIENDRWKISSEDFAVRIQIPDLQGFFAKWIPKGRQLVIEPGTRALIINEGVLIGEIPPGAYTFESFSERLQFWQKNQVTGILTRCEETPFHSRLSDVPALEGICGSLSVEWAVQIADPLPFLLNLFGGRDALSKEELDRQLDPLVKQALFSACGRASIDGLAGPDVATHLAEQLESSLGVRLQRYGLKFVDIRAARFECEAVADHKARAGENWLAARENQLLKAAHQVESDGLAGRLQDIESKVPLRRALRDAVNSDKFAKLTSEEDLRRQLEEIDKDRLLRREEKDALVAAYTERKEDRQAARAQALAVLEIQREQELDELRSQVEFTVEQRSLEREIDLAKLTQTKDALEWQQELQREREEAEHRRQLQREKRETQWQSALQARELKRDDSWKELVHRQRLENLQTEMAVAQAERNRRVAILEAETRTRLAAEQLQVDRQRSAWELEEREKKSTSQLDRLAKLQDLNAKFAERQQRTQLELENLKEDSTHRREVERIQMLASLGTEALIATAKTENAGLLADLKKHEASQTTARSQHDLAQAQQLNDERQRMYDQLNQTERAKADAIAEAYKLAMQSQQGSVQQMIGGLAQAATPRPAPVWPVVTPPVSRTAVPPPLSVSATWYAALNGQQSGPFTLEQLHGYVSSGHLTAATMVWRQGLPNWSPAGQIGELTSLWGGPLSAPPPLMP